MYKFVYFGLISIVAFATLECCENEVYTACDVGTSESPFPPSFPETEEKLEAYCEYHIKYLECALDVLSKTEEECEDSDYPQLIQEGYAAAKYMCDKDAPQYTGLVRNLPCLRNTYYSLSCYHWGHFSTDEEFKEFLLGDDNTELATNEVDTSECMKHLYFTSCFPALAGVHCNEEARDIAVDFVLQFNVIFEPCNPGIKNKLPNIVRTLEIKYPREK